MQLDKIKGDQARQAHVVKNKAKKHQGKKSQKIGQGIVSNEKRGEKEVADGNVTRFVANNTYQRLCQLDFPHFAHVKLFSSCENAQK